MDLLPHIDAALDALLCDPEISIADELERIDKALGGSTLLTRMAGEIRVAIIELQTIRRSLTCA